MPDADTPHRQPSPPPLPVPFVVAIDGPAASGKSSVARTLARRLGLAYVNSGALYRAAAWHALNQGLDPKVDPVGTSDALADVDLECAFVPGGRETTAGTLPPEPRIRFEGREPTEEDLRTEGVNRSVSPVAALPEVRARLTRRLRALATQPPGGGLVMEGRDIGSAVFPQTPFKFYIDASPEVRAQRRAVQGGGADDLAGRDYTDSHRRTAPLVIAEDAHVIDSSRLTIDGVVGEVVGRLKLKGLRIVDCELRIAE